jgi:hypothetical protein
MVAVELLGVLDREKFLVVQKMIDCVEEIKWKEDRLSS